MPLCRKLVIEMFAAFCYVDHPHGHRAILNTFSRLQDYFEEDCPFRIVVKNFETFCNRKEFIADKEIADYLISNMIFFNAIINTPNEMEFRFHLRNQLLFAGLAKSLNNLKGCSNEILAKQVVIYNNEYEADCDELFDTEEYNKLNFTNPSEIFNKLVLTVDHTSAYQYFLSVIQHFMLINQPENIKAKYWQLLDRVIAQIVLDAKGIYPDFTEKYGIDVNSIVEGFIDKDKLVQTEALLKEAQDKIRNLIKEKNDLEQEADALKNDLEVAKKEIIDMATEKRNFSPALSRLNSRNPTKEFQNAIPESEKSSAPVSLLKNVFVPTPPSGPPPPPPPGIGGLPPPPPPMGMDNSTIRAKKQYRPSLKLKQLQWEKIPPNQIQNTIWETLDDEKWENVVEFGKIEELFASKAVSPLKSTFI